MISWDGSQTWPLPSINAKRLKDVDLLDPECYPLCLAINAIQGLETFESCCGHGRKPFRIHLHALAFEDTASLARIIDHHPGWKLTVEWNATFHHCYLTLTGPRGIQAYRQAELISSELTEFLRGASGVGGKHEST